MHRQIDRYLEQPDEVDTDELADLADTRAADDSDAHYKGE